MIQLLKNSCLKYTLLIAILTLGIAHTSYALPPYLSILIPNTNTNWVKGNSVSIIWTDNIPNNVVIKLYKGNTFITTIAGNTPSDGSHSFTVPTNLVNGTDYRVHIAAIGNTTLSDYSSSFSITGNTTTPGINITNPTSNTVWNKGQTVSIQWTDNISGNVGIELYKGGTSPVYTVVSSTASDGSHTFTVPTNLVSGTNYQVHMYEINNTANQTSSPHFTITGSAPNINITNPTNGTIWNKGQTVSIQWTDNISSNVRIHLYRGNTFVSNIASNTQSDGLHTYTVPTSIPSAANYRVRIFSLSSPSIIDISSYFTITTPVSGNITVTSPTTGTVWNKGQTRAIQWTDNISSNVNIKLYKGGSPVRTIATSTASDGSHNYTVPTNLANGSDYRIRIASVSNPSIVDFSNYFTITNVSNGAIVINRPLSNDTWTTGQTRAIEWSDNIPSNVRIELYKGGSLNRTIISSTPSDGFHNYSIPTNLVSGSNYQVKISSVANPSIVDLSDNFTINNPNSNGTITVTNPSSGTVWIKGHTRPIQWTDNISGNVSILLFRDNSVVATIAGNTPSDGLHTYTIPTSLSSSSRYRVRILDVNNSSISDFSDYFTITSFIDVQKNQQTTTTNPNTVGMNNFSTIGQEAIQAMTIAPNPQIIGIPTNLIIEANKATSVNIVVSDITGKTVQQKAIDLQKGKIEVKLEPLTIKGIYFVSLQTANSSKSIKLVVIE